MDLTPIAEWRILYFTVCVTCIGFLMRSGFRVAEFKDGMFEPYNFETC